MWGTRCPAVAVYIWGVYFMGAPESWPRSESNGSPPTFHPSGMVLRWTA